MIEVLKPFEVGAGDTSTVDKHVWGGNNASANEDLLSSISGGAVSTLEDSIDIDKFSVAHMQRFLGGGGDHAVGLLQEEGLRIVNFNFFGVGERSEGAVLDHVILDFLDVETSGVVDGGVVLNHSGDFTTVLLDELGSPVSDSTEALNDEGLALDTFGELNALVEGLSVKESTNSVVDTETGGLSAASNTSLREELARAAALSVDVLFTLHCHVGVLNPGHGLLVGSHVGSEAIDLSTNKVLLDELHSVLASDSLDLAGRVLSGVDFAAALGTTEGDVGDGELESHEGGEGLDLLEINMLGVASTALHGELVG